MYSYHKIKICCGGAKWIREGRTFSGIIYAHQLRITIGQMVGDLEMIARATSPDEWLGRIEYLPLE